MTIKSYLAMLRDSVSPVAPHWPGEHRIHLIAVLEKPGSRLSLRRSALPRTDGGDLNLSPRFAQTDTPTGTPEAASTSDRGGGEEQRMVPATLTIWRLVIRLRSSATYCRRPVAYARGSESEPRA